MTDVKLERQVRHTRIDVESMQESVDRIYETVAKITGSQRHHNERLEKLEHNQIEHTVSLRSLLRAAD